MWGRSGQSIKNNLRVRLSKRGKDNLCCETLQSEKIRGLLSNGNKPEPDRELDQVSRCVGAERFHHFIFVRFSRAG